tara:strand:- start:182 stop:523 length:342 start_codon:yes stop_codon:yes gene_type:complete
MNPKDLTFELLKYGNSNYLPTRVDTLERDLHQKIYELQAQIHSLKQVPQHKRIRALEDQINKLERKIDQRGRTNSLVKSMLNQRILSLENIIKEKVDSNYTRPPSFPDKINLL